jgi:restriction system protein
VSSIAPDELATVIRAALLAVGQEDRDPVCIRDVLWLAATMNTADHDPAGQAWPGGDIWHRRRRPSQESSAAAGELEAPPEGEPGLGAAELFDDGGENSPGPAQGIPARRVALGGPGSLPSTLELTRALRPFRLHLPSRHRMALDVEATIRATAAAGRTIPILRPGAERRFSADLVLDVSPSMLPWHGGFAELIGVFTHVGAFREVRSWRLHVDSDDVSLTDRFGRYWAPGTFRTTDRRRVVIIVTDAVAEYWYQPAVWRHIVDWGSTGTVALIDPLPLKLWNFSGIGPNRVRAYATAAAAANAELCYNIPQRWRLTGRSAGGAMPIPVMQLSPAALAQWSAMVTSAYPAGNAALLVESGAPGAAAGPHPRNADGQATLANFLHMASPEALRLAVLAATSDSTTLAVLRAIQEELLPGSGVAELAEVLVSGIFQHVPDSNKPDLRIRMNAECRIGLQALASPQDQWDVYRAVSAAIRRASPESAGGFQAAVHDPRGNITVREDQQAFAEIARSALAQAAEAQTDLDAEVQSRGDASSARRQRKALELERLAEAAAARDAEAAAKTAAVERQVATLQGLLQSSLARDPWISLASLRRRVEVPPLELGQLAVPITAPQWADFEPEPPPGLQRILGGQRRYEAAREQARRAFDHAEADHRRREAARHRQVAEARRAHDRQVAEAHREVDAHNAHIDELEAGLRENDRHAVSEYIQAVLDRSPYPLGFPDQRSAGYVPESSLLAVEWYLPSVDVVPQYKAFRHIKTRKAVEPVPRPIAEVRQIYQSVIAQVALRTLREIFDSTPEEMISTVVFNGRVHDIDPLTGQKIQPHLITLRATRQQFMALVLDEPKFNPVECVRRYFFADISPHPDELIPVEPVMPFSMADPRIIDPRPNLLELSPKEFEAFIQNLFTKMGFDTKLYQASGDGGIDCVAYDPDPITGGKFIVQAKLYTRAVQPTHVRDLWGTVQREGATKGIMITTSGYGPDSYKFAAGKPLNLIDGSGLLALCHQYKIPARILDPKRKPSA